MLRPSANQANPVTREGEIPRAWTRQNSPESRRRGASNRKARVQAGEGVARGALVVAAILGACVPGTYYDPTDRYVMGLRLFDRGQPENVILFWKPLAEKGDCDAQYRYGTLFFLGAGVPKNLDSAREWWSK